MPPTRPTILPQPLVDCLKLPHRKESPTPHWSANSVVDPQTGASLEYTQLRKDPNKEHWIRAAANKIARLAQGRKDGPKGTDTMFFIKHTDIPTGRKATYLRIVAALKPHKAGKFCIRFTAGGNRVDYPGVVSTPTVDMTTVKCLLNSVVSTPEAKFMTMDISDFYLNTPMERYEYMQIPLAAIPACIMEENKLAPLIHNGFIVVELRKGIYGLPQAGILANNQLQKHLAQHGYHPVTHTSRLYKHKTQPVTFSLCVDDFGVIYVGREHAEHLKKIVLEDKYKITTDWTGTLYVGLTLAWNYKARTVDLSMPGYVAKALERFQHPPPKRPQHSPHDWQAPQYGAKTQLTDKADTSPPLPPSGIQFLQQDVGTLLYYARAVDNTMLVAIGSISSKQTKGTQHTLDKVTHLLNYCATHPEAVYFALRQLVSVRLFYIHFFCAF
jgi:hypothetical protein